MEPKDYTVVKIEGEYAYLRADGGREEDDLFIAMALLPTGIDVGTRLHYEMLTYTIVFFCRKSRKIKECNRQLLKFPS